jgi:Flp pilus assembly protein TadD
MGEYEDALDVLQQADELRPDDPEIMDHLEKAREKLGR